MISHRKRFALVSAWILSAALCGLGDGQASAADGGRFKQKTFFVTYEAVGTDSSMKATLKMYVGAQNEVFAYINTSGSNCGSVGGVARLGSSRTSSFSCNGVQTRIMLRPQLSGNVLTLNEVQDGRQPDGENTHATRRVSFSYDGSSCQALSYYFSFKSPKTPPQGWSFPLNPISCQVVAGRQ